MKKSMFLLCAILATICINAQIEEFDRVVEISTPTQSGSPLGLFNVYDGQHMLNQAVPFNLVGEKVFLSNPNPISISRDHTTYALDDGSVFSDTSWNYMDLEYYTDKLENEEKVFLVLVFYHYRDSHIVLGG